MPEADDTRTVHCIKLQKDLPGLAKPPFRGELAQRIFERVSKEAWDMWLRDSVKYINTYRVDLASKDGQAFMMKQMEIYFGLADGDAAPTAWTPPKPGEPEAG